ncbi:hypothetical protein [Sulfuricystis multivorans]|uniref:hypothetical protein n=1 Tax=Sulfuricystis multivorans TaxID=2211108 RepID=UPI000F842ADF|nr:hypothetical protein [Sulfuricystis multivorans]
MAIVIKAFILCSTDNPEEAENAVFAALNSGVFESANPILDFVTGIEQTVPITDNYEEGTFVRMVPSASLLRTANSMQLPC